MRGGPGLRILEPEETQCLNDASVSLHNVFYKGTCPFCLHTSGDRGPTTSLLFCLLLQLVVYRLPEFPLTGPVSAHRPGQLTLNHKNLQET